MNNKKFENVMAAIDAKKDVNRWGIFDDDEENFVDLGTTAELKPKIEAALNEDKEELRNCPECGAKPGEEHTAELKPKISAEGAGVVCPPAGRRKWRNRK